MSTDDMTFVEAVREGCRIAPRKITFGLINTSDTKPVGACVVGAAMLGALGTTDYVHDILSCAFPWLLNNDKANGCPECGAAVWGFFDLAVHLNNHHDWSRLRIARFIESAAKKAGAL